MEQSTLRRVFPDSVPEPDEEARMRTIETTDEARLAFLRPSQSELEEMRQRQRFEWFAERLAPRTDRHTVSELVERLAEPVDWPGQREKAIVLLALKGTIPALRALEDVDPSEDSKSFRALHGLCLDEARASVVCAPRVAGATSA